MSHAPTPAFADTPAPANQNLLEMAPLPIPEDVLEDDLCDEVPETGPVYVQDGKVTISIAPKYKGWQESVLASMGIPVASAELANIQFEGKTPIPEARISGGLYQPPELVLNLSTSDRLVVVASALEAIAGDAHALACIALAGPFNGLPTELLPILGDRVLILLRDSGKGPGNQALRFLAKAVGEASPSTIVLEKVCPSAKALGMTWAEDAEEPVIKLGKWIKSRGIGSVNSSFSTAIRKEKTPLRAAGGYDALGMRGKECVVFSRSRDVIVSLNRTELRDEMLLGMTVGVSYLQNNHTMAGEKGSKSIDTRSLGFEIIDACGPLGGFDGKNVFGAGVWRNSAGQLVVNSAKAFLSDGSPAKRVDGRDIYVAARDLGITPETAPAKVEEAMTAFDFFNGYSYETHGGALLSFGSTMYTYTCGANDTRPITFEYGLPGCGKTTVCNFKRALLGEACDHLVGTTEAHLRRMNQLNSLGLLLDESEEDDAGEFRKVLNFAHKSFSGGTEGKGSGPGQDGPVSYTIRSSVHMTANKLPDLKPALISRMICIKYLPTNRGEHPKSDLVPNPRALRFPLVEALGKKLFMRMLLADKRNRHNQRILEQCIVTKSSRALMTLTPAIASAYTALHDDELTTATATEWLKFFDVAEAVAEIEEAQSGNQIIDFLAHKPAPRPIHGESYTVSKLWEMADNGERKAISALAVMGMSVHRGKKPDQVEVHLFPTRQGLRDLFTGTDWAKGNLGKMLCDDPRTSSKQSEAKERLNAKEAVGEDATRTTAERYITLDWALEKSQDVDERLIRIQARVVALNAESEMLTAEIEALERIKASDEAIKNRPMPKTLLTCFAAVTQSKARPQTH